MLRTPGTPELLEQKGSKVIGTGPQSKSRAFGHVNISDRVTVQVPQAPRECKSWRGFGGVRSRRQCPGKLYRGAWGASDEIHRRCEGRCVREHIEEGEHVGVE